MKNYANNGYVVKAMDLMRLFPAEKAKKLHDTIEQGTTDEVSEFLDKHLPKGCPKFSEVYVMSGEDESEDLEQGAMYVLFDEEELYVCQQSPAHNMLTSKGVRPKQARWVTWG